MDYTNIILIIIMKKIITKPLKSIGRVVLHDNKYITPSCRLTKCLRVFYFRILNSFTQWSRFF